MSSWMPLSQSRWTPARCMSDPANDSTLSRRGLFEQFGAISAAVATVTAHPLSAQAIPMISTSEFETILRQSGRSIARVEFSGPKNENVQVVLADSTRFGLNDVIESSVDPRSPLKIAAMCREAGVPTSFVDWEALLASTPRRKMYSNSRVQEAAVREREKNARIAQDEEERLAALAQMEREGASKDAAATMN